MEKRISYKGKTIIVAMMLLWLLLFAFISAKFSIQCFAEGTLQGSGTSGDPYKISSVEDWTTFANNINSGVDADKIYVLTDDIGDSENPVTDVVGIYNSENPEEDHPFMGLFDGNDKTVYVNINDGEAFSAPFRNVKGAIIMNLVVAGNICGSNHTGGLVGISENDSSNIIEHCIVDAYVSTQSNSNRYSGGVVGHAASSDLTINNTMFTGTIRCDFERNGGILGWSDSSTLTMKNCFFAGKRSGTYNFHPIACKSGDATVTTYISDIYYSVDRSFYVTNEQIYNGGTKIVIDRPDSRVYKEIPAIYGRSVYSEAPITDFSVKPGSGDKPFDIDYTVKLSDGTVLTKGVDYTEEYPEPVVKAGTDYTLIIKGKGDYLGQETKVFHTPGLEGEGTEANPYLIKCIDDWNTFASDVNSGIESDKYYKLTNDVGSSGSPITQRVGTHNSDQENSRPFMGVFDGNGYKIYVNIDYYTSRSEIAAPFLCIRNATIKNLTVEGLLQGYTHTAGLVSFVEGTEGNMIDGCFVKSTVKCPCYGWSEKVHLGGVVGHALNSKLTIKDTVCTGLIFNKQDYIGGLVGWCDGGMDLTIENSVFNGSHTTGESNSHKFHPIAVRNSGSEVTTDIRGAYYVTDPNFSDGNFIITPGGKLYTEAPSEGLYSSYTAPDDSEWYVSSDVVNLREHYPYTGNKIDLDLIVKTSGGAVLKEGTDYTVATSPSVVREKGDYTLTITGIGKCGGSLTYSFFVGGSTGDGTEENPYLITNKDEWNDFAELLSRGIDLTAWFKMTADIGSKSDPVTTAVGVFNPSDESQNKMFKGHFDGSGKTLYVDINDTDNQGTAPFRIIQNATIKNLNVEGTVTGTTHTAGLVGFSETGGENIIENCIIKTAVSAPGTGDGVNSHIGGIVGHGRDSKITIINSVFSGTLYNKQSYAGGFMGWAEKLGTLKIVNSFFIGEYIGTVTDKFHPIGLKNDGNNKIFYTDIHGAYYTTDSTLTNNDRWKRLRDGEGTKIYSEAPSEGLYKKLTAADGSVWYEGSYISGISSSYRFTEEPIDVVYTMYANDGIELVKDTDYTESFSPEIILDRQDYTLTIRGKGDCGGFTTSTFNVTGLKGKGTEEEPYLLEDANDWKIFADDINAGINNTAHYKLINSIGSEQEPLTAVVGSTSKTFNGVFDGNNKTIYVNIDDKDNQGTAPFRKIVNAEIKNLYVKGSVTGSTHAAGLVGFVDGTDGNTIEHCTVNVAVTVPGNDNNRHLGGVVGHALSSKLLMKDIIFSGTMSNTKDYAGGLIGWCDSADLTVQNCIYKGRYIGTSANGFHPVAIAASNESVTASVKNTYSTEDPTMDDYHHFVADGTRVSKNSLKDAIYYGITAVDGEFYYAAARVDLEKAYRYTGDIIELQCSLYKADGIEISEYNGYVKELSPETLKEKGEYTLRITSRGNYYGEVSYNLIVAEGKPVKPEETVWSNDTYGVSGEITINDRIRVEGDVTLILNEGSVLNANNGIEVSKGNSITIEGTGSLNAHRDSSDAAIGSNYKGTGAGDITINGGTIVAVAGSNNVFTNIAAAAIGGGAYSGCSNITINGGNVTAFGDDFCACIGGGANGSVDGTIKITGGVVNCVDNRNQWTGAGNPAVIGAGSGGNGGEIIITGGHITAISMNGNGIGCSKKDGATGKVILDWEDEDGLYINATSIAATEYELKNTLCYATSDGTELDAVTVENLPNKDRDHVIIPFIPSDGLNGEGTQGAPYIIKNASDWRLFAKNINNGIGNDAWYKLSDDYDNSRMVSAVAGTEANPFKGHFDGAGQTLKVGINDTGNSGSAPFRYIEGATICDLNVQGSVKGITHAAGLVGYVKAGENLIQNCEVKVDVYDLDSSGDRKIGGVVGYTADSSELTIKDTIFSGTLNNTGDYAGGLLGWSDSADITIENSLFSGSFTGNDSGCFHPVAIKNPQAEINVNANHICYTENPTLTDTSYIIADGFLVENEIPQNRIYNIVEVAGRDCYQRTEAVGLGIYYHYTGSSISIDFDLTAMNGNVLTENTDYTIDISPSEVKDKGKYIHTITGKGNFYGKQVTEITVGDDYPIKDDTTVWENGTYHVSRDVTFNTRITVTGEVTLVLEEGYTLNAFKGISVNSGNKLTIEGNGKLVSESRPKYTSWANSRDAGIGGDEGKSCGDIVINGGDIIVKGGYGAAIGGGGYDGGVDSITITGGKIDAWSYQNSACIGCAGDGACGPIAILGGQIYSPSARIGAYSGTPGKITLGWTNEDDYIHVNSFKASEYEFVNMLHFFAYGRDIGAVTPEELNSKISAYVVVPYIIPGKEDALVTLTGTQGTITRDTEINLTANAANPGTNGVWTWKSDNKRCFEVDEHTGKVTVKGFGEAVITASYESDTTAGEAAISLILSPVYPEISWEPESFEYDGKNHIPVATLSGIRDGDECYASVRLKDEDNNIIDQAVEVGTYKAAVNDLLGKDNDFYYLRYNRPDHVFTITKADIKNAVVTLGETLIYNGSEQTQSVTKIMLGDNDITEYCDITDNTATDIGTYTMKITAKDNTNYTGELEKEFRIERIPIAVTELPSASAITYGESLADSRFTGGKVSLEETELTGEFSWADPDIIPEVSDSDKTEYDIIFVPENDNTHIGKAKIKLTVNPKKVDNAVIELPDESFVYTGQKIEPGVTVRDGSIVIPETEYTVSYKNNIEVGTATVIIEDNEGGNYIVSGSATFEIEKKPEPTPTPTASPEVTPTSEPTETSAVSPSAEPTTTPEVSPSAEPTTTPEVIPSKSPLVTPTATPEVTPVPDDKPVVKDYGTKISSKKDKAEFVVISKEGETPAVTYKRSTDKKAKSINIPGSIIFEGITYEVTEISDGAFKVNKNAKIITIPASVRKLGNNLFKGCKKLKEIRVKTNKLTKKSVGKKAFKGVGRKVKIKVYKKKLKAYKKLFRKKGLSKKVKFKKLKK